MNDDYLPDVKQKEMILPDVNQKRDITYYENNPILMPSSFLEVKKTTMFNDMSCSSIDDNFYENKKVINANDFPGRVFLGTDNNYYVSIKLGKKFVWEFVRKG